MSIENLIDELDDIIENAWTLPLSGGKNVVDTDKIRRLLEDIRLRFPKEIVQAKAIVADRTKIIEDAKHESENILKNSEERAKKLLDKNEVIKEAKDKANQIISESQRKSKEIIKAANSYADDTMAKVEKKLSENLCEIKSVRKSLKSTSK